VVLADVGCGALGAEIGRGAIVIGERARPKTRAVIMHEAYLVRQSVVANMMMVVVSMMMMVVGSCLRDARRDGQGTCNQGGGQLRVAHSHSPTMARKGDSLGGFWFPSRQ
jgi:hypothetical protein